MPSAVLTERGTLYLCDAKCVVSIDLDPTKPNVTILSGCGGLGLVMGLEVDSTGQFMYLADHADSAIKLLEKSTGRVTYWVGGGEGYADGVGTDAKFRRPSGLARRGNLLYVADTGNNLIRCIHISTMAVTTVGGDPSRAGTTATMSVEGIAQKAHFCAPNSLTVEKASSC
eukprot:m.306220 g.306220  ORF g.306220 m.306220 type:complete len:171 (+) comp16344_c1_seq24:258-770(+)